MTEVDPRTVGVKAEFSINFSTFPYAVNKIVHIYTIFMHLKLGDAAAKHNFKWVKMLIL